MFLARQFSWLQSTVWYQISLNVFEMFLQPQEIITKVSSQVSDG